MDNEAASEKVRQMLDIELELRTLEIIKAALRHLPDDHIAQIVPLLDMQAATATVARLDCKTWWEGTQSGREAEKYGFLSGKWLPLEVAVEWNGQRGDENA